MLQCVGSGAGGTEDGVIDGGALTDQTCEVPIMVQRAGPLTTAIVDTPVVSRVLCEFLLRPQVQTGPAPTVSSRL